MPVCHTWPFSRSGSGAHAPAGGRTLGNAYGRDGKRPPAYLLMAFDMSAGMAAWMRVRGHSWAPTLEMCAAMFVPVVPLFPLLWLGVIDGMAVMVAAHVLMFPLMLAAMFRRLDEYAH